MQPTNRKLKEIVQEIEKDRQDLIAAVGGLSQQELDWQSSPEDWSVGEILNHLHLVETRIVYLLDGRAGQARERGIGPETGEESALDCLDGLLERAEAKLKAPATVTPRQGISKDELLEALSLSRKSLRESLNSLAPYDLSQMEATHPLFGALNLYQWILLIGRHERRHTNQIRRLIAAEEVSRATSQFSTV